MDYAELELGLSRRDGGSYGLDLRFSQPGSDADIRPMRDGAVQIDAAQLSELAFDAEGYGRALSASLFADPAVRAAFAQARSSAASLDVPLRLRLLVGPSAPELHSLRWETLRDPEDDAPLLNGEQILFSRYLNSGDWRPVKLRPKGELRALVAVANPSDLAKYKLAAVDVAGELERARVGLGDIPVALLGELERARAGPGDIPVTTLSADSQGGFTTLNNLAARLRDGFDILYLVCHGALVRGEPRIWLEDEAGATAVVSGAELVQRLQELAERPRLIVLASCQSAGTGEDAPGADGAALAALGPRLAEAGIPAVLAMQGQVTMRTVAQFMPVFFRELQRDGQIDRAMAVARGAIRARDDAWMPVLIMRLKSGRIWYIPGFGDDRQAFEKWPALLRSIRRSQCTPIIGSHLGAALLGTSNEIAQSWAETYHFPMAPHQREDLPQVAQYLTVNQDARFVCEGLMEYLHQELLRRYGSQLPDLPDDVSLSELFAAVGVQRRAQDPADPYKVLAELSCPLYITTDASNLLEEALKAAGKDAQTELCRWNEDVELLPSIYDDDPDYRPSIERPLVFHLFGINDEPDSLVLTE